MFPGTWISLAIEAARIILNNLWHCSVTAHAGHHYADPDLSSDNTVVWQPLPTMNGSYHNIINDQKNLIMEQTSSTENSFFD